MCFDKQCAHLMRILSIICLSAAIFTTSTAYAGFEKALTAYQSRDGNGLLTEVRNAYDAKSDEGLMLLIYAMTLDARTSDFDNKLKKPNTTLDQILTSPQRAELLFLLVKASEYSTTDTQYYLLTRSVFRSELMSVMSKIKSNEELFDLKVHDYSNQSTLNQPQLDEMVRLTTTKYVNGGSKLAKLYSTEEDKADANNPLSQLSLGLKYLNFVDYQGYGCEEQSKEKICQSKDKDRAEELLKKAAMAYEASGHDFLGVYADAMCDLFQRAPREDKATLKEAYLSCLVGANSGGEYSNRLLGKMREEKKLEIASPELNAVWNDPQKSSKILSLVNYREVPSWLAEVKRQVLSDSPIFKYYFNDDMPYELDVYEDGRTQLIFLEGSSGHFLPINIPYQKFSSTLVQNFMKEIRQAGVSSWPLANNQSGFCDENCRAVEMQVTIKDQNSNRKLVFKSLRENDISRNILPNQRMALIKKIVDKYFPTKKLRFELGSSDSIKKKYLERQFKWDEVAQGEK